MRTGIRALGLTGISTVCVPKPNGDQTQCRALLDFENCLTAAELGVED